MVHDYYHSVNLHSYFAPNFDFSYHITDFHHFIFSLIMIFIIIVCIDSLHNKVIVHFVGYQHYLDILYNIQIFLLCRFSTIKTFLMLLEHQQLACVFLMCIYRVIFILLLLAYYQDVLTVINSLFVPPFGDYSSNRK